MGSRPSLVVPGTRADLVWPATREMMESQGPARSETETWKVKEVAAGRRRIRAQGPFRERDPRGIAGPLTPSRTGGLRNSIRSSHAAPAARATRALPSAILRPGPWRPFGSLGPASRTLGLASPPRDLRLLLAQHRRLERRSLPLAPAAPSSRSCPTRLAVGSRGLAPPLRLPGAPPGRNSPPGGAGSARLSGGDGPGRPVRPWP